ncbi:MAG: hypothetical protein PVSMB1_00960 [Gemmatimonadaceae bacterium]
MGPSRNRGVPHGDPAEQEIREQEVLRANKELAAYFKGRRTEREARGALKIIKAFIRDRERTDPSNRRPLAGAASVKVTTKVSKGKKATAPEKVRRRRPKHQVQSRTSTSGDTRDVSSMKPPLPSSTDE